MPVRLLTVAAGDEVKPRAEGVPARTTVRAIRLRIVQGAVGALDKDVETDCA